MGDTEGRPENTEPVVDGLFPVDEHVEEADEGGQTVRRKGIYLLPNLLTTGNLFCGFYSIIAAQAGFFPSACIVVFIAMLLDGLDGRVARLTNTQSKFGEQYDSMADMVTFGVAPAMVAYSWALSDLGKVGWVVAFIYSACGALRLARFNAQIEVTDSRYFTGLPSPAAAALVAGMIWALSDYGIDGESILVSLIASVVVALAGVLMCSNVCYYSFKKIDLRGRVHFIFMLAIILTFAVIFTDPPRVLMLVFLAYACSGPVIMVYRFFSKDKKIDHDTA
ncbi:MAG: CDP-diacylglycerol--serine O-phosphatidyltransferase [Candidatus Endonucleobacter bathymodioli]|uniref:CDP-diacylglycerol--serine O-phosphatidyltransferase n=1 Tax=Candidatus Endonucleibacter bathymodioli TaxID=539814 RepID=A0AA90NK97_9GAMM|nr:CDP-diacylglycerol--serine O-phosphatidyltransferase [Candidatus Endonucleobacter bathymodioli]